MTSIASRLNSMIAPIHDNAVRHGWWDEGRSFGEVCALIHSELSEALEEYRDGRPMAYAVRDGDIIEKWRDGEKPEGIAVELADAVIRILDWYGYEQRQLPEDYEVFAATPRNFGEYICGLHACVSEAYAAAHRLGDRTDKLFACVYDIYAWAEQNGVDMDKLIKRKHKYNINRAYKHGGKAI